MHRTCWVLLVASLVVLSMRCHPQVQKSQEASDCVILYGPDYSFSICTYQGWIIESTDQVLGRIAHLYLKERDSIDSEVYGYVIVDAKLDSLPNYLKRTIKATIDNYVAANPGMKANEEKPFTTNDKKKAVVIQFTGHSSGRCEAVSFIEESKVIVRIGSLSKTKKNFSNVYKQLEQVVNSYLFLGLKVEDRR